MTEQEEYEKAWLARYAADKNPQEQAEILRYYGGGYYDLEDDDLDGLEEVPDHRNDLGDWCPRSGERTADGTCPLYCHEADVLVGFDAGDRELPADTDLPRELWPPYMLRSEEEDESR